MGVLFRETRLGTLFPPALPLTLAVGSWEESSQLPTAYPSPILGTELGSGSAGWEEQRLGERMRIKRVSLPFYQIPCCFAEKPAVF